MPRSVWQDLAAIQGRTPRVCLPSDNGPGREIVYPGALYPNSAEHVSYDETDFLQAEGDILTRKLTPPPCDTCCENVASRAYFPYDLRWVRYSPSPLILIQIPTRVFIY